MKHLYKLRGKLLLSPALILLLLLLSITGCANTPASSVTKMYSDRVYTSDHLFLTTEEMSDILPDNYSCIGSVEKLVPREEPVETNNSSNCLAEGCELYLNSELDLNDKRSPVRLYAKVNGEKQYQVFSMMHAIN